MRRADGNLIGGLPIGGGFFAGFGNRGGLFLREPGLPMGIGGGRQHGERIQIQDRAERFELRQRAFGLQPIRETRFLFVLDQESLHGPHGPPIGILDNHPPAAHRNHGGDLLGDFGFRVVGEIGGADQDRNLIARPRLDLFHLPAERTTQRAFVTDTDFQSFQAARVALHLDRTFAFFILGEEPMPGVYLPADVRNRPT